MTRSIASPNPKTIRRRLLGWYDRNGRALPWRYKPGSTPDPYRVWLSEIMLAQTTVATVKGYFDDFVGRWPTLEDLAAAGLDDVLHAWQGLGYYARARNLHQCARFLVAEKKGQFPNTEDGLRKLPGIGEYTAAAIAAIVFRRKTMPVEANIERVTARLYAVADPLPGGRKRIAELARGLASQTRPEDLPQAMMDLGATICRPKTADCGICPLSGECLAAKMGGAEGYPVKAPKKPRPVRHGMVFWARRGNGQVLLRKRPEKGLLGGMMEIPSTEWRDKKWNLREAAVAAPVTAAWRPLEGIVRHAFTHFHLELTVLTAEINNKEAHNSLWCLPSRFSEHALPTVMKKVAKHVTKHAAD
ncbi:MAG: Adenine DNA glycosylase [Alphaproteobacteria bacterium MarineAlpha3_Bin1]|nr:MAG: Adenine DNA glycosylase [Alphaproteobacteria bacterium MarineAlpha3_Bin1]